MNNKFMVSIDGLYFMGKLLEDNLMLFEKKVDGLSERLQKCDWMNSFQDDLSIVVKENPTLFINPEQEAANIADYAALNRLQLIALMLIQGLKKIILHNENNFIREAADTETDNVFMSQIILLSLGHYMLGKLDDDMLHSLLGLIDSVSLDPKAIHPLTQFKALIHVFLASKNTREQYDLIQKEFSDIKAQEAHLLDAKDNGVH